MIWLFQFCLFFVIFLSVPTLSFSKNDTTSVAFIAYWSLGDSYSYEITKYTQQWKGDELVKFDSSSYSAEFLVIDSTETSYQIKWKYTHELFRSQVVDQVLLQSLNVKPILEIIYSTDEYGEFVGIDNWEEVRDAVNEIFETLTPILVEGKESGPAIQQVLQQMKNTYQSKIGIEAFVVPELKLLHFPFGASLEVGRIYEYDDSLPNLFGEEPVDAKGQLYLDEVDVEDEYCLLIQEVQLEENSSKSMIMDFFRLSGLDSEEFEKVVGEAVLEINDYNKFGVFYYPGVVDFIHTTRESYFQYLDDVASRRDTVIIILK